MINENGFSKFVVEFLSFITISLCVVLKIPQILKIFDLKGSRGISLIGLLMELISYTITTLYNYRNGYSVLTYLEYPLILIQQLALIYLVLYYSHLWNLKSISCSIIYFSISIGFLNGILPRSFLIFLITLTTPISASSKVIQLHNIIKTKESESISLVMWFISMFTNLTRILTIYLDSFDLILLLNFIISTFLSGAVLVTAYYYKETPKHIKYKY